MKNKLLVSAFAMAILAFALTSCENKSKVTDVCSDMIKESIHKDTTHAVLVLVTEQVGDGGCVE